METLGSLIDKLSIANVKIWHLEDMRNDLSKPDKERLAAADNLTIVNQQRNELVQEIDAMFGKVTGNFGEAQLKRVRVS